MDPQRLTELLAHWMWEYMRRASYELGCMECGHENPGDAICKIEYEHSLMPAWHRMMTDLQLPLEAPEGDTERKVEELAAFIRSHAQSLAAVKEELAAENLDEPTGTMN